MPPAAKLTALLMAMSFVAWGILAWVYVLPWIDRRTKRDALLLGVAPQMFRTLGALAMFPGIGEPPRAWALPLAWGDGITAALAMLSMVALKSSWRHAVKLVWIFSVFGLADLLHNAYNAAAMQVAPRLGPIAYVVVFAVPCMLVFHLVVLRTLVRREPTPTPAG